MRNPKLEQQTIHREVRAIASRRNKLEKMIFNNEARIDIIREEMSELAVRDPLFVDLAKEKMSLELQNAEFNNELKKVTNAKLCIKYGMTNEYLNRVIKRQVFVDGDL